MHLLLHGVGGFVGGVCGYFLTAFPAHCSIQTLTQVCTNYMGTAPVSVDGSVTVGAIIGIVVYHVSEDILSDIREARAKRARV